MFIKLRSFLFSVLYNLSGALYGIVSVLLLPLPLKTRHKIIVSWTHLVVFLVRVICGIRYQVIGTEYLPTKDKPVIVLSKHQSTWETLFLQGLFWPASTVLKRELLRIPFFGWGLAALRPIAIDRSNPRLALKQVKEKSLRRINSGYNILLFPEGTRIPPGERGRYARSGADIAVATGIDIVPVAVNSGLFWPTKKLVKQPGCISVVIGPPISPQGKTSKALIEEVESWIESTMTSL
ncbi:lysophospholipid acyltransferase family protein [Teredinibacter haidensis]|uniref:lysophospholipid acyltransferase family protein n=1 Tax=Teredinibacter haidensis TaxID=2731755 RepID=UPI000B167AEE|nr:lysophospholipid acyltransferase family protein [Teredinibacter haidensis]